MAKHLLLLVLSVAAVRALLLLPGALTSDLDALLAIKASFTSDPNNFLSNWNTTTSACAFNGVECNSNGRVISVSLSLAGLSGAISSRIGDLQFLSFFEADSNSLSESIPKKIGNLRRLRTLDLGFNVLTGSILSTLTNLSALRKLRVSANSLTGSVSATLFTLPCLSVLDVGLNYLTMSLPRTNSGYSPALRAPTASPAPSP